MRGAPCSTRCVRAFWFGSRTGGPHLHSSLLPVLRSFNPHASLCIKLQQQPPHLRHLSSLPKIQLDYNQGCLHEHLFGVYAPFQDGFEASALPGAAALEEEAEDCELHSQQQHELLSAAAAAGERDVEMAERKEQQQREELEEEEEEDWIAAAAVGAEAAAERRGGAGLDGNGEEGAAAGAGPCAARGSGSEDEEEEEEEEGPRGADGADDDEDVLPSWLLQTPAEGEEEGS